MLDGFFLIMTTPGSRRSRMWLNPLFPLSCCRRVFPLSRFSLPRWLPQWICHRMMTTRYWLLKTSSSLTTLLNYCTILLTFRWLTHSPPNTHCSLPYNWLALPPWIRSPLITERILSLCVYLMVRLVLNTN